MSSYAFLAKPVTSWLDSSGQLKRLLLRILETFEGNCLGRSVLRPHETTGFFQSLHALAKLHDLLAEPQYQFGNLTPDPFFHCLHFAAQLRPHGCYFGARFSPHRSDLSRNSARRDWICALSILVFSHAVSTTTIKVPNSERTAGIQTCN